MSQEPSPYTFDRVVRMVLSAVALAALFLLLRYLSDVLVPFAAAVVLAYLLNPVVTLFEQRMRRGLAVAVTLLGLGVLGLALVALIVPLMLTQVDRFRSDVRKLADDLGASIAGSTQPADTRPQPTSAGAAPSQTTGQTADQQPPTVSPLGWREQVPARGLLGAGGQARQGRLAVPRRLRPDHLRGRHRRGSCRVDKGPGALTDLLRIMQRGVRTQDF